MLRPFAGGRRSELTRAQKLFFVDTGIRHHLVGDFRALDERADAGSDLENWVFGELWKALPADAELRFWRSTSKAEVDFVVSAGSLLIGIEVKATRLARPQVSRSARSFVEAYEPRSLVVVNRGLRAREKLASTEILWVAPEDVATSLGALVP